MVFTNPVSINTKNFAQSQSHPVLTCLNPFLRAPTSKAYKQPRVQRRGPRLCAGGPLPHTALLDERVIRRPAGGSWLLTAHSCDHQCPHQAFLYSVSDGRMNAQRNIPLPHPPTPSLLQAS